MLVSGQKLNDGVRTYFNIYVVVIV